MIVFSPIEVKYQLLILTGPFILKTCHVLTRTTNWVEVFKTSSSIFFNQGAYEASKREEAQPVKLDNLY